PARRPCPSPACRAAAPRGWFGCRTAPPPGRAAGRLSGPARPLVGAGPSAKPGGSMRDAAATAHWKRHGWLWLRGFLGEETTRDLVRWTDEIAAWPEVPGKWMRYYERRGGDPAARMLARIENFAPFHHGLAALFSSPRLLELLAACAGEPVLLFKDKINFKLPGGAGFAPHQDAPAYADFGIDHHLTLMAPVDAFTQENGCLELARDACARVFLPQNPDGTLRPGVMDALDVEPLLATPGDVIVFDARRPP